MAGKRMLTSFCAAITLAKVKDCCLPPALPLDAADAAPLFLRLVGPELVMSVVCKPEIICCGTTAAAGAASDPARPGSAFTLKTSLGGTAGGGAAAGVAIVIGGGAAATDWAAVI